MPIPTPDEYRYAQAHLRQALADLKLAQHYAGGDEALMVVMGAARSGVEVAYNAALEESKKPFVPTPSST